MSNFHEGMTLEELQAIVEEELAGKTDKYPNTDSLIMKSMYQLMQLYKLLHMVHLPDEYEVLRPRVEERIGKLLWLSTGLCGMYGSSATRCLQVADQVIHSKKESL